MSENDKCKALTAFMRLPCAAVGTLRAGILSNGEIINMTCTVCDKDDDKPVVDHRFWNAEGADGSWKVALEIMDKIIDCLEIDRPKGPRVLAATSIKNLLNHVNDKDALSLQKSALCQWCMKSLKSSLRELRIAAG